MGLSHLFFLMLLYSGLGTFIGLGFLSQRSVGRRYYLYHGLAISLVTLISFPLYLDLNLSRIDTLLLALFTLTSAAFALTAGKWTRLAQTLHLIGIALAVSFMLQTVPTQTDLGLRAANTLLGSLLLGIAITALCLGYWRGERPVVREMLKLSLLLLALVFIRCFYSGLSLHFLLSHKSPVEISRLFLSFTPGSLLILRSFWGLVGPLLLSAIILFAMRHPARRATTGLFFVAVLCLMAGEALSQYLAYSHGIAF